MKWKIISLLVLIIVSLALISFAFYDGGLTFKEIFLKVIGGINNFTEAISSAFKNVVNFFEYLTENIGKIRI